MEPDLTLAQKDSYLRSCSGEVLHTFIQPFGKEKVPHLILSQTVLFPEGGGQPGDTGHIVTENNNNSFNVLHSFRDEKGLVVHAIAVKKGEKPPEKGDKVTVNVDWESKINNNNKYFFHKFLY
jgi:alanyl-tRNA synthetase